ncbi:hypothetical protein D3C87_364650 [compost metagenome]
MKIERVKELVEQVKRHIPEGGKFCVFGYATLVLEGTIRDCEYVAFVVDLPTHFHLMKIYGDVETRFEGHWVGNNEVRIYTGYLEARVKMVGDIPCRHEAHPDFDGEAMGQMMSAEEVRKALFGDTSLPKLPGRPSIIRRILNESVPLTGKDVITAAEKQRNDPHQGHDTLSAGLILTARNVDVADAVGDYLGLGALVDGMVESRSASKSLLRNPISLKDTPHGEFQAYRRQPFNTAEYRGRLVKCSEEQMKFTDDLEHNRRQYNSASLKVKVTYKRRLKALARAIGNESMTARCMQPPGGHIEPEDHIVDATRVALSSSGLLRKQLLGEGFYKPGMGRTLMGLGPMREPQEEGAIPKPVQDTIEKFIGEEDKKEDDK